MSIKGIDVSSTTSAQNTLYSFQALLQTAGVPEKGGTPEQDADLGMMVTKWVADNAKIVTSLRTTCGGAASGASKFQHVIDVYISPQVIEATRCEPRTKGPRIRLLKAVQRERDEVPHGANTELQVLREMISRLPAEVIGTTPYWIRKIERAAGPNILFWMERVQREDPDKFPLTEVRRDYNVFADLMQAAIDTTREYETMHKRPQAINPHLPSTVSAGWPWPRRQ